MKNFIVLIIVLSLGLVSVSEAKRFGASKSFGFNKPAASKNISHNSTKQSQSKKGLLGGILAAGAIGAMLGYLFSSAGGLGLLMIILLLIGFALLIYKRKKNFAMNQGSLRNTLDSNNMKYSGDFNQENITCDNSIKSENHNFFQNKNTLIDGTPKAVFEHQALNLFNQIQNLNSGSSIDSLKGYLTQDLFEQMKSEILENDQTASFRNIIVDIVAFANEHNIWIGSVHFSGKVKENCLSNWENYSEIWHFSRNKTEHIWKLSGIQQ